MDSVQAHSNYERQLQLEQDMISLGIDNYRRQLRKAVEKNVEASTPAGLRILKSCTERFVQALERYLKEQSAKAGRRPSALRYLEQLEPETVAFIAVKSVLNSITKRQTLQHAATAIGSLLEDEVRLRHFFQENPHYYQSVYKRIKVKNSYDYKRTVLVHAMGKSGLNWDAWPTADKLQIGLLCVNFLIESTGLVELVKVPTAKNDTNYYVCATEKTLEQLQNEHERQELLCPHYLPTIIPPKDWSTPFDGAYHSGLANRLKLVKTYNQPYLDELTTVDMPMVYQAVNRMQRTAWRINARVLEVFRELWDGHSEIADLPPRDKRHPRACPIPQHIKSQEMTPAELEVFYDWKREAAHVYEQNLIDGSKRLLVETILRMAHKFEDEPEIFFPYMLDFRGRVYAVPSFLNPQGSDMAKALLTFANGKPITDQKAADWLAIHGANVYGYDKVSLEERVAFIHGMNDVILRIAENPLDNLEWAKVPSEKYWQFLAFCFEWAGFLKQGFGYVSSLPIALDGSCNGLQHFSAMLRDHVGGEAVNLIPSDKPQDIYQRVADVVIQKLDRIARSRTEDSVQAEQWLAFGIDRDLTKRPVMILPYGGSRHSCRKYIEEYIRKRLSKGETNPFAEDERDRVFEASEYLAGLVWESIGEVVVSAREVMGWLRKAAALAGKEGLPVNWTSPSGFPVQQSYREFTSRRIETKLSGNLLRNNYRQTIRLTLVEPTENIDKRRQANGISPNFVHSMDAACLHLYVCRASELGIENFSLIHDSYGTVAADTELSAQCIRDVFVEMYQQEDVLSVFRTQILAQLSPESSGKLPPIPSKGKLDLEAIKQSRFFFA